MLNPIEKFKRSILHLNRSLHHCIGQKYVKGIKHLWDHPKLSMLIIIDGPFTENRNCKDFMRKKRPCTLAGALLKYLLNNHDNSMPICNIAEL